MRFCAHFLRASISKFQSAPGLEAGRCLMGIALEEEALRFNPRPALRPGDAKHVQHRLQRGGVSIRARP